MTCLGFVRWLNGTWILQIFRRWCWGIDAEVLGQLILFSTWTLKFSKVVRWCSYYASLWIHMKICGRTHLIISYISRESPMSPFWRKFLCLCSLSLVCNMVAAAGTDELKLNTCLYSKPRNISHLACLTNIIMALWLHALMMLLGFGITCLSLNLDLAASFSSHWGEASISDRYEVKCLYHHEIWLWSSQNARGTVIKKKKF